jgi:trk system potassium uptake protein TrkH
VAIVFMLLAGVNFALYFVAWRQRSLAWCCGATPRCGPYVGWLLAGAVLLVCALPDLARRLSTERAGACGRQRSTWCRWPPPPGYATTDYAKWPLFAPVLMMLLGCFATCAGSTGGGIKMVRMLLLVKQAQRELVRIVHPARSPGGAGRRGGRPTACCSRDRLHADLRRRAGRR